MALNIEARSTRCGTVQQHKYPIPVHGSTSEWGFFILEFAYQYTRDADDVATFQVDTLDALGRIQVIERHKLEPVLAVQIVDALDGHFVIAVADLADLAAVVLV